MIVKKLKALFSAARQPTPALKTTGAGPDLPATLIELDRSLTSNEVQVERLQQEILQLEKNESREIARIRSRELSKREERFALQTVKQLRNRLQQLEQRILIHRRNIDVNLNLIAKIEDIKAMQMKGIAEEQIDDIVSEFSASLDEYLDTVSSVELAAGEPELVTLPQDELEQLKAEVCQASLPPAPASQSHADSDAVPPPADEWQRLKAETKSGAMVEADQAQETN